MDRKQVVASFPANCIWKILLAGYLLIPLGVSRIYGQVVDGMQITYPYPDKSQIEKLATLPKGASIIIDRFVVNNLELKQTGTH